MFGDPNQCEPVESDNQINYDYLDSKKVHEMYPKVEALKYIESCRYDIQIHEMLKIFLKHGKVSKYVQPIDRKLYRNICCLTSTKIKVNSDCCNQFTKNKRYGTIAFNYDNKKICQLLQQHISRNIYI